MTKYLAIAFLITGFLVGDAYGEDGVYYCAEIGKNGFTFDKKLEKYKPKLFTQERFKIKFDRTAKTIEVKGYPLGPVNGTYNCRNPYTSNGFICNEAVYQFNFNSDNGRFVLLKGFGYMGGDGDSIAVSFGKCDKF